MKKKCSGCGRKYKDIYTQCPKCGHIERNHYVVRHEEDSEERLEQEKSAKQLKATNKGMRSFISWGIAGLVLGVLVEVSMVQLEKYRYETNPKNLEIQEVALGEPMVMPKSYIRIEGASTITDEWLADYIPKGYKVIGIRTFGETRESDGKQSTLPEFYIRYVYEGIDKYQHVIDDFEVTRYLRDKGMELTYAYESFYAPETGIIAFLVEEGVEEVTLCYSELIEDPLRGEYKGITYEVNVLIEEGE